MFLEDMLKGTAKGCLGAFGFNVLVESASIQEYAIQLLLSILIILIQSLLIPIIKFLVKKIKDKINNSQLSQEDKDKLNELTDNACNQVVEHIENKIEEVKDGEQNGKSITND